MSRTAAPVTLVIADAHSAAREGLPLLLRGAGIAVVGTAAAGEVAEALVARHDPDVVLLGAELADCAPAALLARLLRRGVRAGVVLYVPGPEREVEAAVLEGASGVVSVTRSIGELADALCAVAAGGLWMPPSAAERPAAAMGPGGRRTDGLSATELRVLALVAEGLSTDDMAASLHVSPHTVRTHLKNVLRKLDAQTRAHAVAIALREDAIES